MTVTELATASALDTLCGMLGRGNVTVLSGAGLSTESGIPDYRGETGVRRRHSPMSYQEFTGGSDARRRYWARSYVGWRLISSAHPNDGHRAVADLQRLGLLRGVITQNVDGLHQSAGATGVVELHGTLDAVLCLDCGDRSSRARLDARMLAANPGFAERVRVDKAHPDGDVPLAESDVERFVVIDCSRCGGALKPDVVYFGETVPRARVDASYDRIEHCDLLLVLGSSLAVMSGFRFVLRAGKLGIPVAIVNLGPSRGDERADVRVDAPLGLVLPDVVRRLTG